MSQSSPEGIILGKGSKLVSADLSINGEKVFSTKQEKTYTEEEIRKAIDCGANLGLEGVIGNSFQWKAKQDEILRNIKEK